MSRAPRVTVVVPVHNGERYLQETLDSVAAQSFEGWSAMIVDDASGDSSGSIAAAFANAHPGKVTVLSLQRNVGVAQARNLAIRHAPRTELIALLDQDDCWRPDYLARKLALLDAAVGSERRPGIVACNGWILMSGGIVGTFAERFWWRDEIDLDAMIDRNYILARAMFTREAFDRAGGEFSAECLASDDFDLWLRILEAGYEVLTIRDPLVVYRIHSGAQSHSEMLLADGTIATYRRAIDRGALTSRQRVRARARARHFRALRERARAQQAWSERRPLAAGALAVRATPYGAVAFLQNPTRWGEWATSLRGRAAALPDAGSIRRA